jgi:hypothetical protein
VVYGQRRVIAHVCAALARWESVPDDLSMHVPTLEDAAIELIGAGQ